MHLDTETAAAILKSSAQCNAVAEEATRRIVELMQEAIELKKLADAKEDLAYANGYRAASKNWSACVTATGLSDVDKRRLARSQDAIDARAVAAMRIIRKSKKR